MTMLGNPLLNAEEQSLCQTAPEECLRLLVARGGLSLDDEVRGLSPQLAEAVWAIAAGERTAPEGELAPLEKVDDDAPAARSREMPLPVGDLPAALPDWAQAFAREYPEFVRRFEALPAEPDRAVEELLPAAAEPPSSPKWVLTFAAAFPHVFNLLDTGGMTPHEAIETIRTIDSFLGNYPTGARYAAP